MMIRAHAWSLLEELEQEYIMNTFTKWEEGYDDGLKKAYGIVNAWLIQWGYKIEGDGDGQTNGD